MKLRCHDFRSSTHLTKLPYRRSTKGHQTANFEHLLKFGMNTPWVVYSRYLPGGKLKNNLW